MGHSTLKNNLAIGRRNYSEFDFGVLPAPASVFSQCSWFLPQSKHMQRRLIVDFKWTCVNGCLSLCVGTVSDWWHVQVYPVSPNVSWDRTKPLFAPLTSDTTAPLQKTIKQEEAQRSYSLFFWLSFQKLLLLLFLFAFCLILAKWVTGPWLLSCTKSA